MAYNKEKAREAEQRFIADPSDKNRNEMILHHEGLVHKEMMKLKSFVTPDKYSDLFQEGMIGLMTAAERFDPGRKVKFVTYAGWWVRAAIQNFVTSERAEEFNTIKKLAFDRNPNKPLPNEKARREAMRRPVRLWDQATIDHAGSSQNTYQDLIQDPQVDIEATVSSDEISALLHKTAEPLLKKHKARKAIFYERMVADNPKSLHEVGKMIGLSREGARIHEAALIKDIRRAYRRRRWKDISRLPSY